MSLFFFSSRRRHTRLQGDWSSDVCSSDLGRDGWSIEVGDTTIVLEDYSVSTSGPEGQFVEIDGVRYSHVVDPRRSEERRVGKECRSRGSPEQQKKKRREQAATTRRSESRA